MEHVKPGSELSRMLDWLQQQSGTDLHAQAGRPFTCRIHGQLARLPEDLFPAPTDRALYALLEENFASATCARIEDEREVDLSFYHRALRYRANFSKQRGQQSFSLRTVPQHRLRLRDLQLPDSLAELIREPRGLLLCTGPTGQGKSTTARALIQEINETRAARIVTIEDPIEYVFEDAHAQFEQREVGIDTDSFATGIRNALRQDPNVLFVGEIRDAASIFAALQASETGHLVLTTLHADSVPQALARLREFYPASEQANVSQLLARNLQAVVCQRLLPNLQGTRTPCLEILRRDQGVQDAVAAHNLHLLAGIIESANHQGMHSFDQYLLELLAAGLIARDTAFQHATNRHRLDLLLRGIVTTTPILVRDD